MKRTNDWCVACGAGAAAAAELIRSGRFEEFLNIEPLKLLAGKEAIVDLTNKLGELGKLAWCVACGAAASPAMHTLTDEDIERLAVILKEKT